MRNKVPGKSWAGLIIGALSIALSIGVWTYFEKPQYIRGSALLGCVFSGIIYIHFEKYGKQLWFWLAVIAVTLLHVPIVLFFVNHINSISPALAIPLAMLDGIFWVVLIVVIGGKYDPQAA